MFCRFKLGRQSWFADPLKYVVSGRSMLRGFLDEVTLRKIRGWAVDGQGEPPELTAAINGVPVAQFRPSLYRPDLVDFQRKDLGFAVDTNHDMQVGDIISVTNAQGDHLIGSPTQLTKIEAGREEKVLCLVSRQMKILEIGPSYSPLAPRSEGWNSFSLDHATQQELQEKYRGAQPIERIEPVDYLWKGGPIESAVPVSEHGSFDVIIASHVIEHITDPIGFFLSAFVLIKDQGLISLVVPDKRLMFDFFKPITVSSDYLYAHHLRRTRHSKKTAFDNIAYNIHEKGDIAWHMRPVGEFRFFAENVLRDAQRAFEAAVEDETAPYVDYHGTVYTPSSFALIIFELSQLGIIPFTVARTFPTSGCEFYVTLRKGEAAAMDPNGQQTERLRLMKAIVHELGEQANWITGNVPPRSCATP
jgi:SAM-dependent methyltransferase